MKTIETKIAKNGALIVKVNGKRATFSDAIDAISDDCSSLVIRTDSGEEYTRTCVETCHAMYFRNSQGDLYQISYFHVHETLREIATGNVEKYFYASADELAAIEANGAIEDTIDEYATTAEAQDVAIDAEVELANAVAEINTEIKEDTKMTNETKINATIDPLAELDPAEYAVSVAAQYEAELTETRLANLAAGNYTAKIGDETVEFYHFKIVLIISKKYNLEFRSIYGRKMFYHFNSVIARKKIAEMYMNLELAAVQDKIFHDFNKPIPDTGKHFNAWITITTADGVNHNFTRTFDYFTQAQEYVDTFKKLADDNDCKFLAQIKRPGALGHVFYYINPEMTEEQIARFFDSAYVHGNEYINLNEPVDEEADTVDVFSLQPEVDELNPVDDEPETEISEPEPPAPANVASTETETAATIPASEKFIRKLNTPKTREDQIQSLRHQADFWQREIRATQKGIAEIEEELDSGEYFPEDWVAYAEKTLRERYDRIAHAKNKIAELETQIAELEAPPANVDESTAEVVKLVTELAEAVAGVYVEDWSDTPVDGEPTIIPAADMRELLDGLPATDDSLTAYRKNPDGTFSEDRAAYERLKTVENALLDATTDWAQMRTLERETLGAYTPETPAPKVDAAEFLNANAPANWKVRQDDDGLRVEFKGSNVATVNRISERDLLIPRTFFDQFKPLVDTNATPRQMFLEDRYRELDELNAMRDACLKLPNFTVGQLQTLDNLIERLKRDLVEAEFGDSDSVQPFTELPIIDDDGNVTF